MNELIFASNNLRGSAGHFHFHVSKRSLHFSFHDWTRKMDYLPRWGFLNKKLTTTLIKVT